MRRGGGVEKCEMVRGKKYWLQEGEDGRERFMRTNKVFFRAADVM